MKRPSLYSTEIFDGICDRLANGELLNAICKDANMPDRATVYRWIKVDDDRRRKYDLARQHCMDALSDTILDIAWDASKDTTTTERGTPVANHEWIARSRLKVDTLKFLMAKINPMRFGDKLPEAIQARRIEREEHEQFAVNPVQRIERIILCGVEDLDANGQPIIAGDAALRTRIAELEAQLAGKSTAPASPPKLLTFDPGLPRRLDKQIASDMVAMIRESVPVVGDRDPATVLDEVMSVCRDAIQAHFSPATA